MQVIHGNPYQRQLERTDLAPYVPGPNHGKPAGNPGTGSPLVDPVDLSPEARTILDNATTAAPGNSAQSTAHRARAMMAEFAYLADMSFGKVVSGLANGSLDLTAPAAGDGLHGGDPAAVAASGDGEEIAAPAVEEDGAEAPADATDPVEIKVDDPIPEGGEPETAEETVTEATTAIIDEAPGETPATIDEVSGDEAPGETPEVDLVALFDTDEEILEIVAAAAEETPLDEMTQAP